MEGRALPGGRWCRRCNDEDDEDDYTASSTTVATITVQAAAATATAEPPLNEHKQGSLGPLG